MQENKIIPSKQKSKIPIFRIVENIIDPKTNWKGQSRKMTINHEVSKFTKTFRESFAAFIVSALGVVAALSWNDAIKTAIETLLPSVGNLVYKFYVAIMVTVIAVIITYFISKIKPKY